MRAAHGMTTTGCWPTPTLRPPQSRCGYHDTTGPTMASLRAGKHTFTEWPLGRTTAEATEMAEVARQQGVRTAVGLQARANPAIVHLRNLVADGYVGRVMTCHVRLMREGVLSRDSGRTWQRKDELGAHTLTIACGHTIDALCSVVGEFADVATVVSTQATTWHETDTGQDLPVTSPDNVLVSGNLQSGGVASVQIGNTAWAGSGYRMDIYGEEGTLAAVSVDSPQLQQVSIRGTRGGSNDLQDLTPAAELHPAPEIPPEQPTTWASCTASSQRQYRERPAECPGFPTSTMPWDCIDLSMPSDSPAMRDAG